MHAGALARVTAAVLGLVVATTALAGCADAESTTPLAPVSDEASPEAQEAQEHAETQAARLVLVLQALEDRYSLAPQTRSAGLTHRPFSAPALLPATSTLAQAPETLSTRFNLDSQSRAFIQAQAAYLESSALGLAGPAQITVTATDVAVVGATADGAPVARVVIETTYRYTEGPSTVTSTGYAVSWVPGSDVDAHGNAVQGAHFDGQRLSSVLPLYGQPDAPALDSGLGKQSPSNAVHSYVRAITHGSSANVSDLEGTIRSSDDFRAVLKERLVAGPLYTVVEVPVARTGSAHVLYVIQEDVPGALRLDVILGQDGPTVVPRL